MKRRSPGLARFSLLKRASAAPFIVATAVAGALTLSGCQVMSPVQTSIPYQPAEGVAVDLGAVQIRDFVVVSGAKGEVGTLSGMVVNNGTQPVPITFAAGATGSSVSAVAPAKSQTRLSGLPGTKAITLPSIPAAPGGIVKITVGTPASGAIEVSVPVLLPTGYYASITLAPGQTPAP